MYIFLADLFYVEDISTYHLLGFKRFNVVTILSSLFWKQSREALFKGRSMGERYVPINTLVILNLA